MTGAVIALVGLLGLVLVIRLFSNKTTEQRPAQSIVADIDGPGKYECDIVGESHYQDALDQICGGKCEDGHSRCVDAYLVLEDNNPHDSRAVAVFIDHLLVGHLSRDTARSFRTKARAAGIDKYSIRVQAKIVGGWDRGGGDEGHYGVKLDLPME